MKEKNGLLDRGQVFQLTGKTPTELHELETKGQFPTRKRTRGDIGWQKREVRRWLRKHGRRS